MAYKSTILFDVMNNILVGKSSETYGRHVSDPNFKDVSTFILVKYMSMSPDARVRDFVFERQFQLEKLAPAVIYRVLLESLPRQRSGFIKFIR